MNKTFGDLKSGDIIYYIAWDEYKKVYRIFKYNVLAHEPNNIDIKYNTITIDIEITPGGFISHRLTNLALDKNDNTRIWSEDTALSKGFGVSVDYDEAKKICLMFMRQYCKYMFKKSNDVISEMNDAITKFNEMLIKYVG